ncbi:uracil-DNA glycosylase [Arcobacter sp. CECT 8989]|uniref:uracil-DNA glycosylase n=1 Tax=Arcobacter sp. CECT 8989 TaxID=2044509 RepID=UPI00100BAB32|nr:uracil-DNA glycosylase [Arcobacter sp. CECT 8989]RXJ99890.1 uracil-DNA glycosylase [Arcobacter sp. CECT 8989]
MTDRIVCQKCIHYFVTWQQNKPHGCKAYGFKSKIIPSVVVKNSSGLPCSFFQLKNPQK